MASVEVIQQALRLWAGCYHRKYETIATREVLQKYLRALGKYDDRVVLEAADKWTDTQERLPTISQFLALVGSTDGGGTYQGCLACQHTGYREVSYHFTHHLSGRETANVSLAPCPSCDLGLHFKRCRPDQPDAKEFVKQLKAHHQKPKVYWTDATHPRLTSAERYIPTVLARVNTTTVKRLRGKK